MKEYRQKSLLIDELLQAMYSNRKERAQLLEAFVEDHLIIPSKYPQVFFPLKKNTGNYIFIYLFFRRHLV